MLGMDAGLKTNPDQGCADPQEGPGHDRVPLVKFLPSYVGSKACWIGKLEQYRGRDFVEFFAGSGVISANLASQATLNDSDPFLHAYFRQYESQPIVKAFTGRGYFAKRSRRDWWRWLYYLQKMSFSGVYRWSKNGYNVPIKPEYKSKPVRLGDELERSIARFKELGPTLHNLDYLDVPMPDDPDIAVLDPPYQFKAATWNAPSLDFARYWEFVHKCVDVFKVVIVFDWEENMRAHLPGRSYLTRKMRVNGARAGALEAMCVVEGVK
jgi:site-specific DNA-adenine methylase